MLTSRVVRYMHANTSLGATKGEGWGEWLSCTLKVFLLGVSAVIAGFHSDVMMVSIGFCLLSCGPRVAGYLDMVSILDVPIGCQFGIADWGNREQPATGFHWFFGGGFVLAASFAVANLPLLSKSLIFFPDAAAPMPHLQAMFPPGSDAVCVISAFPDPSFHQSHSFALA